MYPIKPIFKKRRKGSIMKHKNVYYLLLLFFVTITSAQGNEPEKQVFKFANNLSYYENSEIDMSFVEEHYLGQDIALKFYLFKDTYTTIQPATPTSPTEKTIVNKQTIYYAVKKISRNYKKEIKNGLITEADAKSNLNKILDVSLSIYSEETEEFEAVLKSAKSSEEIYNVFSQVVLE